MMLAMVTFFFLKKKVSGGRVFSIEWDLLKLDLMTSVMGKISLQGNGLFFIDI